MFDMVIYPLGGDLSKIYVHMHSTLNVQTYALEMFKKILRKTNSPHGSDHR